MRVGVVMEIPFRSLLVPVVILCAHPAASSITAPL
jgi:hypothetical protein